MTEKGKSLVVFENKNIRRKWFNDEWWFSVVDIIPALTDSTDPKQYIKKMRSRDNQLNDKWGTICTPLKLMASDGKMREINCVNVEGAFRVIVKEIIYFFN